MKKMTQGSIVRHLLSYALPLILGNFFQLTYNAVDSIIIGKFAGEGALAAVSASNPVMTIVILGVSGISIGASVLMSRFFGAGDEDALRREVATTILFGGALSLAIFALGMPLTLPILRLMSVPQEILPMAGVYLRIIFVGFLFTFQYNILAAALRSVGDSRTPVIFLALASVLNGTLDAVFIAGLHWGVAGAGLATVIAEAVSALLCLVYMRRRVPLLRLRLSELRIDRVLLSETVRSGSITALQQACQPVGKLLIQRAINAQGVGMIAAFNAVSRVDDFACIPEQSISSGMMTCVARRGAGGARARNAAARHGARAHLRRAHLRRDAAGQNARHAPFRRAGQRADGRHGHGLPDVDGVLLPVAGPDQRHTGLLPRHGRDEDDPRRHGYSNQRAHARRLSARAARGADGGGMGLCHRLDVYAGVYGCALPGAEKRHCMSKKFNKVTGNHGIM